MVIKNLKIKRNILNQFCEDVLMTNKISLSLITKKKKNWFKIATQQNKVIHEFI